MRFIYLIQQNGATIYNSTISLEGAGSINTVLYSIVFIDKI